MSKPTSISTSQDTLDNNNKNKKAFFLSFFLSNLNKTVTFRINNDLFTDFSMVLKKYHIKHQSWFTESMYDYVQEHKPNKSIVNMDTYIENPDFIAVPNMHCSIQEKRKYLFDSDDNELKRFGRALEEWLAIYNQEFGKR